MNNLNLDDKTLKLIQEWPKSVDLSQVSGVTTQLQNATTKDIVFYGVHEEKAEQLLLQRIKKNAPALLVTYGSELKEKLEVPHVHYNKDHARELISSLCDAFYPLEKKQHRLVAITGTNGKTSCVGLCAQITSAFKDRVYSLGTLGLRDAAGEEVVAGRLTTPGLPELRKLLFDLPAHSIVYMEASSHALEQGRLKGLEVELGAWTNFGYDHLDYHQNLDNYFTAKSKIFELCRQNVLTLESQTTLNLRLKNLNLGPRVVPLLKRADVQHLNPIFSVGYNIENLSLAKAISEEILSREINLSEFKELSLPPGRMTTIEYGDKLVVVDYAHTPDALDNVCRALKESFPDREFWVVFGCGGDRDKTKRPMMMKVVENYTENIIVTSDNPRNEDPLSIIENILKGASREHLREVDRAAAIKLAMISASEKAVILIAGKGHEDYQEVGSQRLAFSDTDVVHEVIKGS